MKQRKSYQVACKPNGFFFYEIRQGWVRLPIFPCRLPLCLFFPIDFIVVGRIDSEICFSTNTSFEDGHDYKPHGKVAVCPHTLHYVT